MTFEDISFPDPKANLEHDDVLLVNAERGLGNEALRFWESPAYFVVLGRTGREDEDVDLEACRRDGVSILRRSSGGGTVLQGPGCLNFSLVLAKKRHADLQSISRSYEFILAKIILAMQGLGIKAEFRPICDLVLVPGEKKFSGNAQRRGREFILHHGTILYDFDLALVGRYLKIPRKVPVYRKGRSHGEFVTNIPVAPDEIRRSIQSVFLATGLHS